MTPFFKHLALPESVNTLLFDMDGVLLDSLALDVEIASPLFTRYCGRTVKLEATFIKSIFAYDPTKFMELIFDRIEADGPVPDRATVLPKMLEEYLELRRTTPFPLLPGVKDILETAKKKKFHLACVSNNPLAEVKNILKTSGIDHYFSEIVGNDMVANGEPLRKKPAPDCYLHAADRLGVQPENCAVFEDSVLGSEAGVKAAMHVVSVLTGSADAPALQSMSPAPQQIFPNLLEKPL